MPVTLYSYWRSTTAYRVRIALARKGLDYDYVGVDLLKGEQRAEAYGQLNPINAVPTLALSDGRVLTQSMAILEYLEEVYPTPALLPVDPILRAEVRAAAMLLATDVHPVVNLKVAQRLLALGQTEEDAVAWIRHWTHVGLTGFQTQIRPDTPFCFGDAPSWADICLVALLYNAHRRGVDAAEFARLLEIEERCLTLPAFQAAHPDNQPDAEG